MEDDKKIGNNNLYNNFKLSKNNFFLIITLYILVLFYFSKFNLYKALKLPSRPVNFEGRLWLLLHKN